MTFAVLRIVVRLTDHVADPFILFRVRDGFQEAFRRVSGCSGGECRCCDLQVECPFRNVFAQELSSDPATVRLHQKPPLPFAFRFPVLPAAPNAGVHFDVLLTLVGRATSYVREFLETVKILLDRNVSERVMAARVERIESLGYHGEPYLLYSANSPSDNLDTLNLLTAQGLRDSCMLVHGAEVRLNLLTPLKLMQEGHPMRFFSFSVFIRTLLRRVSSLASYYSDDGISADYRWLVSLCESVTVVKSSIHWAEWGGRHGRGKLAGLLGEAVLTGVPDEFIQFLLLGEHLNVGKGASFGLGCFTVVADES